MKPFSAVGAVFNDGNRALPFQTSQGAFFFLLVPHIFFLLFLSKIIIAIIKRRNNQRPGVIHSSVGSFIHSLHAGVGGVGVVNRPP